MRDVKMNQEAGVAEKPITALEAEFNQFCGMSPDPD
jgi:hypothetical protein